MSGNFIKLYNINSTVENAFFLHEGTVYFYLSNVDKYAINGTNLIVGSTELIVRHMLETETERVETAVADGESSIKKMNINKFIEGMNSFSFSLNVSMVLARQVLLTNEIINKNLNSLTGEEQKVKDLSIQYYAILNRFREEYEKRKIPWMKDLLKEFSNSITYKRGEAFSKTMEPSKLVAPSNLGDKGIEYDVGSIICEEGTTGDEMYILQSGAIDVYIKGNRVTSITEPGTVIGEMALLLGEKRTATLKAKNTVNITRIRKEDLKDEKVKQSNIVKGIALSLAKRHYFNVIKVGKINRSLMERSIDAEMKGDPGMAQQHHHSLKELNILKSKVEEIVRKKDADYLQDLIDGF